MAIDFALLNHLKTFLTASRQQRFKTILNKRTRHFTVAVENVYLSHNASAVLRSCEVFGIQDVHIIEKEYAFKTSTQITKGANKWLTISKYSQFRNNTLACIESLKKEGYQIVATTPHTNACELQNFDVSKKSAFFFGVEKEGLSDGVLQNADITLKIPMYGFSESLNISVAAAIILQYCTHKLKASAINWQLSRDEKDILELAWTKKTIKSVEQIISHYYESKE
ncbi:MAG: RNA methyltransferase [Flavobacteriaceae bacterium]|nr:RNA methyltransferase [Flavobacteriaceae bacterium]